jgi:hypothetical protein
VDANNMDYALNFFLIGAILGVFINLFIIMDMKKRFPDFYKKIGGIQILNPYKQIDVLIFLLSRKYIVDQQKKFHIYDVFILNLIILLGLFVFIVLTK